ncbi:lysophospholipase [Macrococcus equipercicus]|uniref:Lysophospholipase n=1 Tax=Macrococcus equipercicus TaxID=69967 RepID=A0ABQ6RAL4_9STAP|nr:alpha/beta fold hydrolase [Macrococcus equipercicus]KAA1040344.1 lysophospholipase [Macrococcus equipercicus]
MKEYTMSMRDNQKLEVAVFEPAAPIGTIQVLHGMAEHMARYYKIGEYFEALGYKVIMHNHMGHGKTIGQEARGHFEHIETLARHAEEVLESLVVKDKPVILIGHSMGSMIARQYVVLFPDLFDALVLSGTSYYDSRHKVSLQALNALMLVFGKKAKLRRINQMTLKQFNKKIKPLQTESDWLSRNVDNVKSFIDDPYTGFDMSLNALAEILRAMKRTQKKKEMKKMNYEMPVLLVSGEEDAFSNYGKGIKKLGRDYKSVGMKHVRVQLYTQSRHEVLFESNQDEVLDRILLWIKGIVRDE